MHLRYKRITSNIQKLVKSNGSVSPINAKVHAPIGRRRYLYGWIIGWSQCYDIAQLDILTVLGQESTDYKIWKTWFGWGKGKAEAGVFEGLE